MSRKILLLLLFSGLVNAETITIVSGDDYAPYADSKLPDGGIAINIIKKAFSTMNIDVKIEWKPWARGFNEASYGNFAGTAPYFKNPEREKLFIYSNPVIIIKTHAFIKKGQKKFDFTNTNSLIGSTMCLPVGWGVTQEFSEMLKNGTIKRSEPKNISTCAKMVALGRADYFITDELQIGEITKRLGISVGAIVMDKNVLIEQPLYFIVSKKLANSKNIISIFNNGLTNLHKNGLYDKIIRASQSSFVGN